MGTQMADEIEPGEQFNWYSDWWKGQGAPEVLEDSHPLRGETPTAPVLSLLLRPPRAGSSYAFSTLKVGKSSAPAPPAPHLVAREVFEDLFPAVSALLQRRVAWFWRAEPRRPWALTPMSLKRGISKKPRSQQKAKATTLWLWLPMKYLFTSISVKWRTTPSIMDSAWEDYLSSN